MNDKTPSILVLILLITISLSATETLAVRETDSKGVIYPTKATTIGSTDDWPMFGQNPGHTGYSPSELPAPETNNTLWQTRLCPNPEWHDWIKHSPAIADGRVYVGGVFGFSCLDAFDGYAIWQTDPGELDTSFTSSPAVADGKVYFMVRGGLGGSYLSCRHVEDGFEISIPSLGAQKQILGGGKYKEGIGFAIGFDRLMLKMKHYKP